MDDPHWTPKMVAFYLEEAADTLRRLPEKRIQGYRSTWPEIIHDFWDAFGWEEAHARRGPPSPAAIDRMDVVLPWLRWLERDEARLVWLRANGRPWKLITHEFGVDRTTAWRRWTYAMITIAARLNAEGVATSCNTFPCNTAPLVLVD